MGALPTELPPHSKQSDMATREGIRTLDLQVDGLALYPHSLDFKFLISA